MAPASSQQAKPQHAGCRSRTGARASALVTVASPVLMSWFGRADEGANAGADEGEMVWCIMTFLQGPVIRANPLCIRGRSTLS